MKIIFADGFKVKIDDGDFVSLGRFVWHVKVRTAHHLYVYRYEKRTEGGRVSKYRCIRMHRQIMGFPALSVDHKNGDTLDNRRRNLREATQSQQGQNARHHNGKQYKGVTRCGLIHGRYEPRKPWRSRIRVNGKLLGLGWFAKPEDAARAYNKAAKKYFGKFASLNDILAR